MKVAAVGELATQVRGVPYRKAESSTISRPGTVGVVRAGNISGGELALDDLVYVPQSNVAQKQLLRKGDVLVAASSGSLDVVGKAARIRSDYAVAFGAFCKVLRPSDRVDPGYFAHYFQTRRYRSQVSKLAAGANINNLKNSHLDELEMLLPQLKEQQRIAGVLDAAYDLRVRHRQALVKLDILTQAIFIDMFGDTLTSGPRRELREFVNFVGGGTPSKSRPDYFDGDICWATSKDMRGKFLDDTQDHITEAAVASSATKLVPEGSVLVVVKSKVLAHTLPILITRVPACFGQDLKGLLPVGGVSPEFVACSLKVSSRWLLRQARGVNTEGLTLEQLRAVPIPDASAADIASFTATAREVEGHWALAENALQKSEELFGVIQQRAFRGDL